jgi:TatA/E family protein of Tat protein translocase
MFGLGAPELLIILGVSFLIFGGKKLPELGEGLGKGISSFKRALHDRPAAPARPEGRLLPEEESNV